MTRTRADGISHIGRARWASAVGGAAVAALVACSGSADPTTTAPLVTTSTIPATTTTPPTTTVATTTTVVTTTVSPDARTAEIEAIVKDVEVRRLRAVFDGNAAALVEVVATQKVYDAALEAMETLEFTGQPTRGNVVVRVEAVLMDREDCLVARVTEEGTRILGPDAVSEDIWVLWPSAEYGWRLATFWGSATPESVWIDDCDLLDRTWEPPE